MLDFRVYSFLAVCKYLSYTRAAQELNLTQPAITQHIQYLQKQYQVKFFNRKNNQLSLTTEGELFRNAMLAINQAEKKIQDDLLNTCIEKHIIRFGATKDIAEYELPQRLAIYLNAYPDRALQLSAADTPVLLQQLNDGILHFAIVDDSFPKNEYKYIPWSTEELVCICSHPMPDMEIHLKDLLSQTLILYTSNLDANDILLHLLESKNITLFDFNRIVEVNSFTGIKQLVIAGCGIAFLIRKAVSKEIADGLLYEIPIVDCDMHHSFNFIWRKDSINEYLYRFMYEKLHDINSLPRIPITETTAHHI